METSSLGTGSPNPRKGAGLLSIIFMTWMYRIINIGRKRELTGDDLYSLMEEDQARNIVNGAEHCWASEIASAARTGKKPRLWRALLKTFTLKDILKLVILRCLNSMSTLVLAVIVWYFLKVLNESVYIHYIAAIPFVVGIAIVGFIKAIAEHPNQFLGNIKGAHLKVAIIGLVYKKILSTRRSELSNFTTGHIINLVSNDAVKMEQSMEGFIFALTAPLEVIVSVALMWRFVGWQSLSGVLYLVVLLIYNLITSKKFGTLRSKAASATDKRLATINSIICGIRTVKMYAWEWNFRDLVKSLRSKEMRFIRIRSLITSSFVASFSTATPAALLISVLSLLYSETPLMSFRVFTLVVLLNISRFAICIGLANTLLLLIDARVAVQRVEDFLLYWCEKPFEIQQEMNVNGIEVSFSNFSFEEEQDITCDTKLSNFSRVNSWRKSKPVPLGVEHMGTKQEHTASCLKIENAYASWSGEGHISDLRDVSVKAAPEELTIITGPVGSGKSSLLLAILGELSLQTGSISGRGNIAYVSQIPWVFSGTIRENILFGKPFMTDKYDRVLEICDLQRDLQSFAKKDLSFIGHRGVCLSGGQRARVSLARAVYSDADIFLLDDPLSAVDAKVGQILFDKCISGVLDGKMRILVTHQLQYLRKADLVVLLKEGQVEFSGSYDQFKNTQLSNIICNENDFKANINSPQEALSKNRAHSRNRETSMLDTSHQDIADDEEEKIIGSVSWKVYWTFFRAGLPTVSILLLVIFFLICQASLMAPNWWLSQMVEMTRDRQKSGFVLTIFACLVGVALILSITRIIIFFISLLRCSENLHDKMTVAILKSPVLFMDRNPVGRIMNRFSKDIGCIDEEVPKIFVWSIVLCLNIFGVMILTCLVDYRFVLGVIPIVIVFCLICWLSLKTIRELKRLESIRCSPVYAHVADTINGLEVIRSSNMENEFLENLFRYQDEHSKALFLSKAAKVFMGLYLDLVCVAFIVCVAVAALLVNQDAATTGLLIAYAIELVGETGYGIGTCAETENLMTSVERVITYTQLPSEPAYSRKLLPPPGWPDKGALKTQNMSLAYVEGGKSILKDIDLEVLPRQKVGIVGRTGAGKSSLVTALFRMPDPQGKVMIDGVDLGEIDIQVARSSMAVISQDPVLFASTLRKNLDPFHQFTDQQIWTALEDVQLKDTIQNTKGGLNLIIAECGSSLSVGERQLLCLARALLKNTRILIMDEATANVDYKTDQLIQKVIRLKFQDCTVLTIAHRLNTIMDYDKVLVMDKGRVVEFDTPQVLAGKEPGMFSSLLKGHGH